MQLFNQTHNLRGTSAEAPMPFAKRCAKYSFKGASLYIGGLSSDKSSLIGPMIFDIASGVFDLKIDATEILGPIWFAKTLC